MANVDHTKTSNSTDDLLLAQVRDLHSAFTLVSTNGKDLLNLPDEWLLYILKSLRREVPTINAIPESGWYDLLPLLTDHYILQLIYRHSRTYPPEIKPPRKILDNMRSAYQQSIIESIEKEKQLSEIVGLFEHKGVNVIVLKGSALAYYLYPDPALRSSIDIDLLVKAGDVRVARSLLEEMGYICLEKNFDVSRDVNCEEVFSAKNLKNKSTVEIHWNLSPYHGISSQIDAEQFFNRAVEVKYSGLAFEVLDPVDALIHAANHMIYNHSRSIRLNWIYDIYLLCGNLKSRSDWETLQKRSVEFGARLSVEKAIELARCWTGLQIPYGFDDFSRWPAPLEEELEAFSLMSEGSTQNLIKLMIPKSATPLEKCRHLFRLVFPPRNIVRACYPPSSEWLLPLSYVKRWVRWLKRLHF